MCNDAAQKPMRLGAYDAVAVAVVVLGAVPRAVEFIRGRNLWSDEAILAWNAVVLIDPTQTPIGEAMAPPGFMAALAAGIQLYGYYEQALRALPFVAGVAVLPLTYLLARRLFSPQAGLVALALAAFTQPLIIYSNEVRPYTADAAIVLAVLYLAWPALTEPLRWPRALGLAVIGAAAPWLSFPSLFVLAPAGLALFMVKLRGERRELARLIGVGFAWIASVALMYALFLRPARGDADTMFIMNDYYAYAGAFMPLPPENLRELRWFPVVFWQFVEHPMGLTSNRLGIWYGAVAAVLLVTGIIIAALKQPRAMILLSLPVCVALFVSGLELYPFYQRTILWIAPIALCFMGRALQPLLMHPRIASRIAGAVVCAILIAPPALRAARITATPVAHHELNRALTYVAQHAEPGDYVYLRPAEHAAYRFMTSALPADTPPVNLVVGDMEKVTQLPEDSRLWFVPFYDRLESLAPFLETFEVGGEQQDVFHASGASAFLYTFD